jgi:hypothetical protein
MRTPDPRETVSADIHSVKPAVSRSCGLGLLCLCVLFSAATACKKDVAFEAMDSDANGYVCLTCGAKLYTDRSVFIGPKCPKCNEDRLIEVVGYYCTKDQHLSIRARRGDPQGPMCDKCQEPLVNAMRSPREKDLKAWGATKAAS